MLDCRCRQRGATSPLAPIQAHPHAKGATWTLCRVINARHTAAMPAMTKDSMISMDTIAWTALLAKLDSMGHVGLHAHSARIGNPNQPCLLVWRCGFKDSLQGQWTVLFLKWVGAV